jgi:hypothetical protein
LFSVSNSLVINNLPCLISAPPDLAWLFDRARRSSTMAFELVIRNARLIDADEPVAIGVTNGTIEALEPTLSDGE